MKITGLDKAQSNLSKLRRNAEALGSKHNVSLAELFPPTFMVKHSEFGDLQAMVDASGFFDGLTEADGERIAEIFRGQPWSSFVGQRTRFSGWEEMQRQAVVERVRQGLIKGL